MKLTKNAVYDKFRCLAAACPDSCCQEWSITVDPDSAAYYRALPGELGEQLRQVLTDEDGSTVMTIQNGRCPMWRSDSLCRIQAQLGHDALCKTCRDFPRLTHDYGDFQEWGLELSCPEAARLILTSPSLPPVTEEWDAPGEAEYDPADMALLLRARQGLLALAEDPGQPVGQALALALMYGYHAQSELDYGEPAEFDPEAALETAQAHAAPGDAQAILDFFKGLEILTDRWRQRLAHPSPASWQPEHLRLFRYFIERYCLQAISDLDLVGRVKLAVISCLTVRLLGGDVIQTAQLYAKEIENDPENVEAILDGAYAHPALTDDKLLGLLLL